MTVMSRRAARCHEETFRRTHHGHLLCIEWLFRDLKLALDVVCAGLRVLETRVNCRGFFLFPRFQMKVLGLEIPKEGFLLYIMVDTEPLIELSFHEGAAN